MTYGFWLMQAIYHVALDRFDSENRLVYVESFLPPADKVASTVVWLTFERDHVTPEEEW